MANILDFEPYTWEKTIMGAISDPKWLDVRLWVYSRRLADDRYIDKPKLLMANSDILKKSSYLGQLLEKSDASLRVTRDSGPPSTVLRTDAYEYTESDSDLDEESVCDEGSETGDEDEDEDEDETDDENEDETEIETENKGEDNDVDQTVVDQTAVDQSARGDQERVHEREKNADAIPLTSLGGEDSKHDAPPKANNGASDEDRKESELSQDVKRIYDPSGITEVIIEDVAGVTFQAFLFFLLTGNVFFREYFSADDEAKRLEDVREILDNWETTTIFPVCSPKSAYRLAHKYEYVPLQTKALKGIKAALTPRNVLDELFSAFTAKYREVRDVEIQYLLEHFDHPDVLAKWPVVMESFSKGLYPYASGIMSHLLKKLTPLSSNVPSKRPLPEPEATSRNHKHRASNVLSKSGRRDA